MLQIFNSQSGKKETFTPRHGNDVRMYVCGMTVYDFCHVGHARVMVVFDVIVRYLRFRGYNVTYVRNITDIDDKIIKRAVENRESIQQLTERFITAMHEDAAALGVAPPDMEPRATQHIDDIVAMVQTLIDKGFAYRAPNGDVYFQVSKFASYGSLSRENLEDQRVGARIEADTSNKRDPLDFVVWKAAKPGEPSWPSPWSEGRPGWHIECSAMSTHCLGNHFDIHGGGMDLKFPHHENEIAQSEAATGEKFVDVWMHNGFVQINEEKMSKSLGNFFTVRDVMEHLRKQSGGRDVLIGETMRYFILSSHYRGPLNYSLDSLANARGALERFYIALRDVNVANFPLNNDDPWVAKFVEAMDDDFNTPGATAVLFDLARELNRAKSEKRQQDAGYLAAALKQLGGILGILQVDPSEALQVRTVGPESGRAGPVSVLTDIQINELIGQRNAARKAKNFAESDRIRDDLKAAGVILEDGPGGTTWSRRHG